MRKNSKFKVVWLMAWDKRRKNEKKSYLLLGPISALASDRIGRNVEPFSSIPSRELG
jgi:hypothetical protein